MASVALNIGISLAVTGLVKLISYWVNYEENLRDKLEEVKSECSELESELSSLNDELETTQAQIKTLEAQSTLTFVEQEELENLKATNAELERTIALLRFDDILSSALELGELKNKDFELPEETKSKIADFTKSPSTDYALVTLIKYYHANRQEDTDWVVLPVANFDFFFGSTSFSKKQLTDLVKVGAIERENRYNISRFRVNEVFDIFTVSN